MSILRLAFWLALIVLLLPTDAQQQTRFSNFANTAMERVATFCDRNGKTCAVGGEVWATFLRKAEFGVRLVGDLLGTGGRQVPDSAPPAPAKRVGSGDPRAAPPPAGVYQPPWRPPARPSAN